MMIRILMGAVIALALTGCNTVEGVGKDVKKAGESIERAADRHKYK